MKKKQLLIMILSFLLIFSSLSIISKADRNYRDFVKINEGDEYIWRIGINSGPYEEFQTDSKRNLVSNISIEAIKMIIDDVEQMPDLYYSSLIEVEIEIQQYNSLDSENNQWEEVQNPDPISLYSYKSYYYDPLYDVWLYEIDIFYGPYFIPSDLSWSDMADWLEYSFFFGFSFDYETATVFPIAYGLVYRYQPDNMELVEFTIQYTAEGVLETYELKYGGELCIVKQLQSTLTNNPPVFILVISGSSFLTGCIIYFGIKKKRGKDLLVKL